jgi:hypothetical protein
MSCMQIYHTFFYPWWKEVTDPAWKAEEKEGPPPMCDLCLYDALQPSDPRSFNAAEAFALLCRGIIDQEEEQKHDSPHDYDGLSPELEAFHAERLDPDMLFDFIEENEASQLRHELQREKGFPSFATFMRARYSDEFADVVKRAKHFHCRCPTHAALQTKLMQVRDDRTQTTAEDINYCHDRI